MKKKFFLPLAVLTLAAALILTACGPEAGRAVKIQAGAIGCRTWYQAALSWVDCNPTGGLTGVVEDHPDLGHEYNGRVRVQTTAFGPLWFEPGDLTQIPEK